MLLAMWNNTAVIASLCYCQDYSSYTNNLHELTSNYLFADRSIQFGPADVGSVAPVDIAMCVVHSNGLNDVCRNTWRHISLSINIYLNQCHIRTAYHVLMHIY